MLNLDLNIPLLLYRYSSVYLPGLGTFIKKEQPSAIKKIGKEMVLIPPKEEIIFKEGEIDNNFIINHFVSHLHISYQEVEIQLAETIAKWKEQLEKREIISFEGFGNLVKRREGEIFFVQHTNYLWQDKEYIKLNTNQKKEITFSGILFFLLITILLAIAAFLAYTNWFLNYAYNIEELNNYSFKYSSQEILEKINAFIKQFLR